MPSATRDHRNYWGVLEDKCRETPDRARNSSHTVLGTDFWKAEKDSGKVRVITDLRALNSCHAIQQHHPQTWKQVVDLTQDPSLRWAITLDLKAYYHHLALHPATGRWMRFWYNNQGYQAQGMPFGWSLSPFWSHRLAKPIRQKLQEWGIPHAWFVDDVLILGSSQLETTQRAQQVIQLLTQLGVQINREKSMTEPAQVVEYLGHTWDLSNNKICPLPHKIQSALKAANHQRKGTVCTPKHIASLAGILLDQAKSNVALWGLPKQLMRQAGTAVAINKRHLLHPTTHSIWNKSLPKSLLPHLQPILQQSLQALNSPTPVQMRPQGGPPGTSPTDRCLGHGLGSMSLEEWKRSRQLRATMGTRPAPDAHHPQGGSGISIGSTPPHGSHPFRFNLDDSVRCIQHSDHLEQREQIASHEQVHHSPANLLGPEGVYVRATHIPGAKNTRADYLSRQPDAKNYRLKPEVFQEMCTEHRYWPELDLFANRKNRQTQKFCSWRVDRTSMGNAWDQNWSKTSNWLNPPWELISRALRKLRQDKATALCCLPVWKTAPWWYMLQQMMVTQPTIKGGKAVPGPQRGGHACPAMANPFCGAGWLTKSQMATILRQVEALHDIPVKQRIKWLQEAMRRHITHRSPIQACIKRLTSAAKGPKYPVFYDISPSSNGRSQTPTQTSPASDKSHRFILAQFFPDSLTSKWYT
jgi:hypothetical protein